MSALLDIINEALLLLGERPLATENDPGKAGILSRACYTRACRQEWYAYPWRVALRCVLLAPTRDTEGRNVVRLPEDAVQVLSVSAAGESLAYMAEQRLLYLEEAYNVQVVYHTAIAPIEEWPSLLGSMIALRLALLLCEPLTQSPTKQESLRRAYYDQLRQAKQAQLFYRQPVLFGQRHWGNHDAYSI